MSTIFLIKSSTVDLTNYTIKNVQSSTKRLDVIIRCILAALMDKDRFYPKHEIWVFLDKYGGFIFNSEDLDYDNFPKNELLLCDAFVKFIRRKDEDETLQESLKGVKITTDSAMESIENLVERGYQAHIMIESGEQFEPHVHEMRSKDNLFIIGNQEGELISSEEIKSLDLKKLCLGNISYLASQVIRLINIILGKK